MDPTIQGAPIAGRLRASLGPIVERSATAANWMDALETGWTDTALRGTALAGCRRWEEAGADRFAGESRRGRCSRRSHVVRLPWIVAPHALVVVRSDGQPERLMVTRSAGAGPRGYTRA